MTKIFAKSGHRSRTSPDPYYDRDCTDLEMGQRERGGKIWMISICLSAVPREARTVGRVARQTGM